MYVLIRDNNIKVGPRDWKYYFFKQYLDDNGLDSSALPVTEPANRKVITPEWKIIPVSIIDIPTYNSLYEQLAGPYLTLHDDYVSGVYTVIDLSVESSKNKLKQLVTDTRYKIEVGGCKFTFSDGTNVTLYTSREDRSVYLQAYQIMSDDQTLVFKFEGSVFKSVTRDELGMIVATGATHIQSVFDWESVKYAEIDSCNTISQLKLVIVTYPENK